MTAILSKAIKVSCVLVLTFFVLHLKTGFSQNQQTYPRVVGYFSTINPIGTWTKDGFTSNFGDVYTIAFPFGLNLLKSDSFGVSFEVAPFIRTENNISKVSTVLFNPGAMFRFKHGLTLIGRVSFETNGRFGFGPVVNKVIKRGKDATLFACLPFPVRFGNGQPASIGAGVQVGVLF